MSRIINRLGFSRAPLLKNGKPVEARFWEKVSVASPKECWIFDSKKGPGYRIFGLPGGIQVYAHRWAYEEIIGKIPDGFELHHTCENGSGGCVNPFHIDPLTLFAHRSLHKTKTHCKRGHELVESNLYRNPKTGRRACNSCKKLKNRKLL